MNSGYIKVFWDFPDVTRNLTEDEIGRLILAMVEYAAGERGVEDKLTGAERILFPSFQAQIDRDKRVLSDKRKASRENGKKGGRPKKQDGTQETEANPEKPNGCEKNPENPVGFFESQKRQDKDKEKEKDKEKDKDKDNSKGAQSAPSSPRRFRPPSLEDVANYCKERENSVNPERFFDYYAAQGWVLSNGNKMKDWKAAVRTWEKKRKESDNGDTRTGDNGGVQWGTVV